MNAEKLLEKQQGYFKSGATRAVDFRIHQLNKLKKLLQEHEQELFDAVHADFGKPAFETYATELGIIHAEISHATSNLAKWAEPQRVSPTLATFPSQSQIIPEPYGSVLIIAPWNYPVQLALLPLAGAIAAGNTAVIKPSELTSNTSSALSSLINSEFQEEYITVVEGGVETNQELLKQSFDYIFFTGSTRVGKIVMKAAAQNLTPLTLELGGKSPCIIDETADLDFAAKRVAWGKFLNAGQTCVAPDYVLIHPTVKETFLQNLKKHIHSFYGDDPRKSQDYARIINRKHFERLKSLLGNGQLFLGGESAPDECYLSPTVLDEISWEDEIMQEEIFGPVLPVLTFQTIQEAIEKVNNRPKPLALYLFTENEAVEQQILNRISFGGGAINEAVAQLGNHHLPFGGVGNSGFGSYHGKASFDLFSHYKSIMKATTWFDIPLRYPPYEGKLNWIKRILK